MKVSFPLIILGVILAFMIFYLNFEYNNPLTILLLFTLWYNLIKTRTNLNMDILFKTIVITFLIIGILSIYTIHEDLSKAMITQNCSIYEYENY